MRAVVPLFPPRRATLVGLGCGLFVYLGYAFATHGWMMYAFMVGWLGAGIVYPSLNAAMSRQAPPNAQGEVQGAVGSLYGLASVLGPPVMTQLFGRFTADGAAMRFPGAAFLLAGVLTLISGLLFVRATRASGARHADAKPAPA
jgi:DHA1 family tetracycline resistance protein-like MFS transporter